LRSVLVALVLLAGALAPAGASAEELEWPEPHAWGEPVDPPRLAQALREALARVKWQVETDTGSALTARHEDGERVLRIRLEYGERRVTYHYVESAHYSYEEEGGRRYIHRRANRLLAKLSRAVGASILQARSQPAPLQVVPLDGDEPGPPPEESE